MRYELKGRIIWTDISSIPTPAGNYFYGSINVLDKNSEKLTTLCIRAFNTKEKAEEWVKESLRSEFPNIQYKG